MVNEVTMICMDTSTWMEHPKSYNFLLQIDAIGVYCEKYLQSHTENYVGVLAMGGKNHPAVDESVFSYRSHVVVEPTNDLSLITSRVRGFRRVGGGTLLVEALTMASSYLNKNHENLLKRLVVFAGGPLCDIDNQYTKLGTKLKERGVAVDVVNFGDQQVGYKKHQLLVLLAAVNNNNNTRMLDLCGHRLNGSSITPLVVGQGESCLYAVYLLQGEDLQKAKNQCDKVHGHTNVAIGYFFQRELRVLDERRKRYRAGYHRKLEREWDIGKDIPFDDDAGKQRYGDQGDRYGRKRDYRVRDEGRDSYRVRDRRKLKRDWDIGKDTPLDVDAGKERYWSRGDSLHDLKPDGGNDDTRNRKQKRDDRGHDEGRERYWDRGDSYGRKRDDRGHDEGRERYKVVDGNIRATYG